MDIAIPFASDVEKSTYANLLDIEFLSFREEQLGNSTHPRHSPFPPTPPALIGMWILVIWPTASKKSRSDCVVVL
jgi:hypothetical protein